MPYCFEVDGKNQIARCRLVGRVSDAELKECYLLASEIAAQKDFRAGVFDVSAITTVNVFSNTMVELAELPPIMPNPEQIRVIIAEPLHIYGMARTFALVGQYSRPHLHVVRSEKQAWAILGVERPRFEAYTKESAV
jgi:hypothetical protein